MARRQITTVFFDLDGTLLDHDNCERVGVTAFYKQYNIYFNAVDSKFYSVWSRIADEQFLRFLKGELSFDGQRLNRVKLVCRHFGMTPHESRAQEMFNTYLTAYESAWQPYYDVIPCLAKLKSYSLGIISNGELAQQTKKLTVLGIRDYFSTITTTSDAGAAKPDKRIFLTACQRAGVDPQRCCYIGDDYQTDIVPATGLAMRGLWLNRRLLPAEADAEMIYSLSEIRGLLK